MHDVSGIGVPFSRGNLHEIGGIPLLSSSTHYGGRSGKAGGGPLFTIHLGNHFAALAKVREAAANDTRMVSMDEFLLLVDGPMELDHETVLSSEEDLLCSKCWSPERW